MIGVYYEQLRLLEFEEYVARQTGDKERHKRVKNKINKLVKKIEEETKKEK